jgi:Protein of unknown function (DUF1579)
MFKDKGLSQRTVVPNPGADKICGSARLSRLRETFLGQGTSDSPGGVMRASRSVEIALLILIFAFVAAAHSQTTASAAQPQPCADAKQKQLDFWVGDWDLTWPGEKQGEVARGSNNIKRIMDGCVVQENFSGGDSMPLRGMSVSLFDTTTGKWKQTWVDNEGGYLDFVGEFKDGQMILAREASRPDGTRILQRMVFKNISPNELDWSWEAIKRRWQDLDDPVADPLQTQGLIAPLTTHIKAAPWRGGSQSIQTTPISVPCIRPRTHT